MSLTDAEIAALAMRDRLKAMLADCYVCGATGYENLPGRGLSRACPCCTGIAEACEELPELVNACARLGAIVQAARHVVAAWDAHPVSLEAVEGQFQVLRAALLDALPAAATEPDRG